MKSYTYDAIVIGSGAAGYNAAVRLSELGVSVAVVTENSNFGTSRNTGSDKQTYYKLGLGGECPDSVRDMAKNLFDGGSVDGDNALCEAALSVRCFMHLCELGVEFPTNRYGEYVGYKTDHDPYARATSAGPLTSKYMTEALERRARELEIPILSGYLATEILKLDGRVCGALAVNKSTGELTVFKCNDIVLATGGPAGIYADSVYPDCHTGSTSLALLAGAKVQNLTEWQYGLASVAPRWNVSGTYMQALPRFVSVDSLGAEHDFLLEYFEDLYEGLSLVFLKGYQWPFDINKVVGGSSVIDLLVYRERVIKGRRVYLDFTKNPTGLTEIDYERLSEEASIYLSKANATFGKPIDRLKKMNAPAVELYMSRGVDLSRDYLEIALSAQHNNGGISVDAWWKSSIKGLFAAGECAGTHGVTRPGGSALNAGQVGSLRAAQYISRHKNPSPNAKDFEALVNEKAREYERVHADIQGKDSNVRELIKSAQRRMSDCGAAIRNGKNMIKALGEIEKSIKDIRVSVKAASPSEIYLYYKLRDILITQKAVLSAMVGYCEVTASSRGSALYYDKYGVKPEALEEIFRFSKEDRSYREKVQELSFDGDSVNISLRDVREIPCDEDFFENVWRTYRENKNIF